MLIHFPSDGVLGITRPQKSGIWTGKYLLIMSSCEITPLWNELVFHPLMHYPLVCFFSVTQGRNHSSASCVVVPLRKSPMWRSTCRRIRCGHRELGVPSHGALSLCKSWHSTPTSRRMRKMQVPFLLVGWSVGWWPAPQTSELYSSPWHLLFFHLHDPQN